MECQNSKWDMKFLPEWLREIITTTPSEMPDLEDRMRFVISLSKKNVTSMTGGPFGAAIFQINTGHLVAVGVNLVVPMKCSLAHAEIVAIGLAQQKLETHDLAASSTSGYELVTSCEPCAMCFGAIPWSGVRQVISAARDEDARNIGFDEGPKVTNWVDELQQRGILVQHDILRFEAVEVLNMYKNINGEIYNSRNKSKKG